MQREIKFTDLSKDFQKQLIAEQPNIIGKPLFITIPVDEKDENNEVHVDWKCIQKTICSDSKNQTLTNTNQKGNYHEKLITRLLKETLPKDKTSVGKYEIIDVGESDVVIASRTTKTNVSIMKSNGVQKSQVRCVIEVKETVQKTDVEKAAKELKPPSDAGIPSAVIGFQAGNITLSSSRTQTKTLLNYLKLLPEKTEFFLILPRKGSSLKGKGFISQR